MRDGLLCLYPLSLVRRSINLRSDASNLQSSPRGTFPLFTGVRGRGILRTSPLRGSPKLAKNNALNSTKIIGNSSPLASVAESADLGGADESRPYGRRQGL